MRMTRKVNRLLTRKFFRGEKKQFVKDDAVKALFDLYEVEYSE